MESPKEKSEIEFNNHKYVQIKGSSVMRIFIGILFVVINIKGVYAQEILDCKIFMEGTFDTYVNGVNTTKVKRTQKFQKEYVIKTGAKIKLRIDWLDDCSYKLTFIKANNKFYENRRDKEMQPELIVTITEINGLEYYYEARFIGVEDYVFKSRVIKTN